VRVLFTTQPFFGHWHPLVPLARALEAAGHEIAFVTTPAFCATISANGFLCFPAGADETDEDLRERLERLAELPGTERAATMWADYFAGIWAERSLPDMLAIIREWRPDLLVREDVEFAGPVAAERLAIPHAALQVAAYRPHLHQLIAPNLDRLRSSVGLSPVPPGEMLHRYLLIYPLPLAFHDPTNPLPQTAHPIRYEGFDASSDDRLPAWVEELPDLPTVYATLGTVANRNMDILQAILDGLREEPVNVVLTTGRDVDPAIFGEQPAHIHVERYIPQSLLFPHCDLVIYHGGSGTVRDALKHGLPMVIIPVSADQYVNAQRCEELGLARVITSDRRTPEAIRVATQEVLQNPSYRMNAMRMREEMQALPGLAYAVGLLERLARERTPLTSQSSTN
jgi:UDP:flavonoid glycosyltransferase YjiC (YdhE family)